VFVGGEIAGGSLDVSFDSPFIFHCIISDTLTQQSRS